MDVIDRESPPVPWAEGEKIPWSDPAFSQRMLQEHLSQEHDAASRRAELIDQHVDWIHNGVLAGRPGKILDLGCGPGLYIGRLSQLGHLCVSIDYGPASIAYARERAEQAGLAIEYLEADIREASYGELIRLLREVGFAEAAKYPSLVGPEDTEDGNYIVLAAKKA